MPLSTYEDQTEKLIIEALEVSPVPMSVATLQRIAHIKERKKMMVYLNCLCADKILVHHSGEFYVIHPELRVAPEKEEQMEVNEVPNEEPEVTVEEEEALAMAHQDDDAPPPIEQPKPVRPPLTKAKPKAKLMPKPAAPPSDPAPRVFHNKTSRYLGVSKKGNVWVVQGSVNGSPIPTKTFKDETLAARYFDEYLHRHATDPLNRRYNFPAAGEKNQQGERLPPPPAAAPHKPVAASREISEPIAPPVVTDAVGNGATFTLDLAALAKAAVDAARNAGYSKITLSMEELALITKK